MSETKTYRVDIFIAGERPDAVRTCRDFCWQEGLCVTVTDCDFVYTAGAEKGVRIGLINYPRFPSTPEAIYQIAIRLAETLMVVLAQRSCTVQGDDRSVYLTREAPPDQRNKRPA